MVRKYIKRDFTDHAYTTEYLSDEDEYIKFEIFSFDPKFTKTWTVEVGTLSGENGNRTNFKSYTCLQSQDKINPMEFTLNYNATEGGLYRIDILYEKNSEMYGETSEYNTAKDLVGWYDIYAEDSQPEHKAVVFTDTLPKNAKDAVKKAFEKQKKNAIKIANSSNTDKSDTSINLPFEGENNCIKRKTMFEELSADEYKIEFGVPHNCYVYGVIIRKIVKFYGTNNDEVGSNLMFTKATLTNSEMGKSASLECTIGYDDSFECNDSPSGFYIDYMDECNLYVKNNEGIIERVFGGYISTPLPDDTRKEITIHSADRLKDGENKYILDQLLLQNGNSETTEYVKPISFDSYAEVIRYLCRMYEITLNSNVAEVLHIENEKFRDGFTISFGKNKDVKKIPVTNGQVTINKNNVTLRNNADGSKKQLWTIYKASKTPIDISNYDNFHITCGMGNVKTETKIKETTNVDVGDSVAGSQKFGKCGQSADKKYVMGIGKVSAGKSGGFNGNQIYKTIFKNKCPRCGKETLVWDSARSDSDCVHCGGYKHSKREWGNISETEISCASCCSDFDCVTGWEKDGKYSSKLTKVGSTVKSSKAEQTKLHKGEMYAVPKGSQTTVSADDIFKAIRNACKGWTHRTKTGTTASYLEKHHVGDCWAWSDWIGKQLKKYKVNYKIVEYKSGGSDQHRSVLYQNSKGKYVDFPYRKYNFPSGINNTAGSTKGKEVVKYLAGGRINQATTSGSTTKTQTVETTVTKGFDKENAFQCYIDIIYSIKPTNSDEKAKLSDKKYHIYLNFTQSASSQYAMSGLEPVWVNNAMKRISVEGVVSRIQSYKGDVKVYLHGINFVTPKIKATKDNKTTTWYTVDKTTKDNSSCKMYLSKIEFNNAKGSKPEPLDSCGKTVNELMQSMVEEAGYTVVMEYGEHRCDDKINFKLTNSNTPVFTATEGDNNNILDWGNISYNPANELFNMSRCVFKKNDGSKLYGYVESKFLDSIMKYQEQCTLITENGEIGVKEAYWNARHNDKFNPEQTYTFTITVKGFPDLKFGELVEVIANTKKLNSLKEVNSITLHYDITDKPVLQTELGLGELAPDIQVNKTIKQLRDNVKQSSTNFDGTAVPISTESIYEWEQ